jgi:protein NrfC
MRSNSISEGTMTATPEVRNLVKKYGDLVAGKRISLDLEKGAIFGLLSANGASTTTTISMISGLIEPTRGDAFTGGYSITHRRLRAKSLLGVVPQEIELYPTMRARQNLEFFGWMYGLGGRELGRRVDAMLDFVELTGRHLVQELVRHHKSSMGGTSMGCQKEKNTSSEGIPAITRRDFIKVVGSIIFVAGTGGCSLSRADEGPLPGATATPELTETPGPWQTQVRAAELPPADGYLLVDIKKCQGCLSCMLACSLVHEGVESLSLSRIQIVQDSFASFPDDLTIEQCRQCVDPACVKVCPTGALSADACYGNVRMVDKEKCIGCGLCHDACPFTPSRAFLAADRDFGSELKSRKCDLCANAPYHWDEEGGGPDGKQACVEVCPVGAIVFTREIPMQEGDSGYKVNLRRGVWGSLGFPTS